MSASLFLFVWGLTQYLLSLKKVKLVFISLSKITTILQLTMDWLATSLAK